MLGNKGTRQHYRTGGTRGGQDQFKWEDVKTDKYRENYLGHSAMAPIGRWQKNRDILWYTKQSSSSRAEMEKALRDEIESIKQNDEDLLNEALGLKPKKRKFVETQLQKDELKQLFGRGETERTSIDIERIEGLGAAPSKTHEHIERGLTVLEKEILRLKEEKQNGIIPNERNEIRTTNQSNDEHNKDQDSDNDNDNDSDNDSSSRNNRSKKSKKHKKEKKEKKEKKHKKKHKSSE